jgi:hypothetical protein
MVSIGAQRGAGGNYSQVDRTANSDDGPNLDKKLTRFSACLFGLVACVLVLSAVTQMRLSTLADSLRAPATLNARPSGGDSVDAASAVASEVHDLKGSLKELRSFLASRPEPSEGSGSGEIPQFLFSFGSGRMVNQIQLIALEEDDEQRDQLQKELSAFIMSAMLITGDSPVDFMNEIMRLDFAKFAREMKKRLPPLQFALATGFEESLQMNRTALTEACDELNTSVEKLTHFLDQVEKKYARPTSDGLPERRYPVLQKMLDNAVKLFDAKQYKNLGITCTSFLDNLSRFADAYYTLDPFEKIRIEMSIGRYSPSMQFGKVACAALKQVDPNVSPTYASEACKSK